jgi:hypothetical protein
MVGSCDYGAINLPFLHSLANIPVSNTTIFTELAAYSNNVDSLVICALTPACPGHLPRVPMRLRSSQSHGPMYTIYTTLSLFGRIMA